MVGINLTPFKGHNGATSGALTEYLIPLQVQYFELPYNTGYTAAVWTLKRRHKGDSCLNSAISLGNAVFRTLTTWPQWLL